jgi:hypothetical protein
MKSYEYIPWPSQLLSKVKTAGVPGTKHSSLRVEEKSFYKIGVRLSVDFAEFVHLKVMYS